MLPPAQRPPRLQGPEPLQNTKHPKPLLPISKEIGPSGGIRSVGFVGTVHERGYIVNNSYFSDYISVNLLNPRQRAQIAEG